MGFGNPYGDAWSPEIVTNWANKIAEMGIKNIALADTVGSANPEDIKSVFSYLIPALPNVEFGAHLHTKPNDWHSKVDAAYTAGCRRFDSAMKGFGGCPMADDKLTGNFATENLLAYCQDNNIETGLNIPAFDAAMIEAQSVFVGHN
jgi:hydroxymethylglutaryl-CoA lyase